MYAVIQTGGKQYKVQPGDVVQVEKLEGDVGTAVKFNEILLVSKPSAESSQIWLGQPLLKGALVESEIVGQGRGEKVLIVKMKRRKQYRRTQGHRQFYTQLLITSLDTGSGEKAALSATDKTAKLAQFRTHLKAKGPASSPKILGSRKRLAAAKLTTPAATETKKAPAKKAAAKKAK